MPETLPNVPVLFWPRLPTSRVGRGSGCLPARLRGAAGAAEDTSPEALGAIAAAAIARAAKAVEAAEAAAAAAAESAGTEAEAGPAPAPPQATAADSAEPAKPLWEMCNGLTWAVIPFFFFTPFPECRHFFVLNFKC